MTNPEKQCCEKCDVRVLNNGRHVMCDNHDCSCHSPQPQQEGWEKWTDGDWKVRLPWVSGEIADDGENLLTFGMSRLIAFIKALLTSATRDARREELEWVLKILEEWGGLTDDGGQNAHYDDQMKEYIQSRLASLTDK